MGPGDRLAHRFPDGQLYVNLQGATAGATPLNPTDVLVRWLRSLGDTKPAADCDEAANRFRTALAGRRMLVVLDNAANEPQVRPLLPATSTCAVLVTSRRVLATLDGTAHLHLDALPEYEAIDLLARVIGMQRVTAEPDAAAQITRLCGHLPLALRIAAARLVAKPRMLLGELADRLSDEQRRLDELAHADLKVRASFQVSYDDLHTDAAGRDAARVFRLVGMLDCPDISVEVTAALADLPAGRTEAALDQLADAQLLESHTAGRYRMHDLVRLFARERAYAEEPETERTAALQRTLDCYIATAKQAT